MAFNWTIYKTTKQTVEKNGKLDEFFFL
jgi:hypothetical protein